MIIGTWTFFFCRKKEHVIIVAKNHHQVSKILTYISTLDAVLRVMADNIAYAKFRKNLLI